MVDGQPEQLLGRPGDGGDAGRRLLGNRSGRSSSAKAYSSLSSRGKQRHSLKKSAAGPSGSGTWTRLRGSPNSDTLPVATSKLATIIVSVRGPVRPGPASPPSSSTVTRPGTAVTRPLPVWWRSRSRACHCGSSPAKTEVSRS